MVWKGYRRASINTTISMCTDFLVGTVSKSRLVTMLQARPHAIHFKHALDFGEGQVFAFDFNVGHNYSQHLFVNIDSRYLVGRSSSWPGAESVLRLP